MKFKYLAAFTALVILVLSTGSVFAQEGEMQVVDEVIAQVNDDVITLSMLKRENKERVEALKQSGMTEQQATAEVAKHQAELIATLINEKLLLQKGKELDLADEIETEVNRRMLQIAQEQGINSIEKLNQAMVQSGLKPEEVRSTMRTEIMKQAVLQNEVDRRVYLSFSPDEVKKYYDSHVDKFRTPESIKLSEIYLSSTAKDDANVKARALELVSQIRAGADFGALAAANSEREKNGQRTAPQDKGSVGEFEVPSLREDRLASLVHILLAPHEDHELSLLRLHRASRDGSVEHGDVLAPSCFVHPARRAWAHGAHVDNRRPGASTRQNSVGPVHHLLRSGWTAMGASSEGLAKPKGRPGGRPSGSVL